MQKLKIGIVEDEMLIARSIAAALHEMGYDAQKRASAIPKPYV